MRTRLRISVALLFLSAAVASADTTAAKDTQLVEAIKAGNTSTAVALINDSGNPNAAERDGTTALHWAVRNDDVALIDRLILAGADVQASNRYGVTPIYLACQNGSAPAVERLVKAGVSAGTTAALGETALHTCARTGKVEAARILLEHGAPVDAVESWRGQTPLMWATARKHPDMMRTLIAAGADVNARSAVVEWERQRTQEPRDKWLPPGGLTPLLFAGREGCAECASVLIVAGADVNTVDPDRHSSLVIALINGHYDTAAVLIEGGIDLELADKTGRRALYAAVDAHTPIASGRPSPQELVGTYSSFDIIRLLVEGGADVNAALRQQVSYRTKLDRGGDGVLGAGTTPLIRAAKAGDGAAAKLLLEHGADPTATTRNGVNALMIAANVAAREEDMTGREKTEGMAIETMRLLAQSGLDINASDTQGRTAAHGAAMWGMTDVIRFLHEQGARLDIPDTRGFTPLDTALGLAGGFGFDGRTGVPREETAQAIRELMDEPTASARN